MARLLSEFVECNNLIRAIAGSNDKGKACIADAILVKNPEIVVIYCLSMRAGSDNFIKPLIQRDFERIKQSGPKLVIYESALETEVFEGLGVLYDLAAFKEASDVIVANRMEEALQYIRESFYTRCV